MLFSIKLPKIVRLTSESNGLPFESEKLPSESEKATSESGLGEKGSQAPVGGESNEQ
jgi:hypothetical protein